MFGGSGERNGPIFYCGSGEGQTYLPSLMPDSLSAGTRLILVSWTFPSDFVSGVFGIQFSEAPLPVDTYTNFQFFLRSQLGYDFGPN